MKRRGSCALMASAIVPILSAALLLEALPARAQTATAVEVVKSKPGALRGKVVARVDGRPVTIANDAWKAWVVEGGKAVVYTGADGAGGYENEGQSLWRYEVATGNRRKLVAETFVIEKVVDTRSQSGRAALLVSMVDGGLGAPHVAVVDPLGGEVWRQTVARFIGVRSGRIAVALYRDSDIASGEPPQPVRTLYLDLDELLGAPAATGAPLPAEDAIGVSWKALSDERRGYWKASVRYPAFGGGSELATLANRTVEEAARQALQDFVSNCREQFRAFPRPLAAYEHQGQATVSLARPQMISVYIQYSEYTGGAHGDTWYECFTFGYAGGKAKQLKLVDLFRPKVNVLRTVSRLVIPKLRERQAMWVVDGTVKELVPEMAESFVVTPSGLSFLFEPYAMGPYAQGSFIIKVPFDELASQLDPNGPLQGVWGGPPGGSKGGLAEMEDEG